MKESTYPLERELGMNYYASDTPGIGGRLRTTAEDFVVEEVPCSTGPEGPYLICRLTKKDWELQHLVKELANRLGISHRRVGFAGTKDRHAVTSQLISIYNADPERVRNLQIKDVTIEVIGTANTALSLGALSANRFCITIRDACSKNLREEVAAVTETCRSAVPNYFGVQRFGVIRPLTHRVGEFILKEDYEDAVCCYVGEAFPGEPDEVKTARRSFLDTRDPVAALKDLPVMLSYERSMLHHLATVDGDYQGALHMLPPKLLSMFVSAFQSYLYNKALSMRISDGRTLSGPVAGDRLIFENGREDRVSAATAGIAAVHVSRGRCRIAIFMPGSLEFVPAGPDDRNIESLMQAHGITHAHFTSASRYVKTKFDGALRPISLSAEISSEINGNDVKLSFSLPPGHYATTVCREYMKADPLLMI
jgi:tRNA pseudouridine synthase, TruD family